MTPEEFIKTYYEYDETEFEPQSPWMKFSFSDLVHLLTIYGNSIKEVSDLDMTGIIKGEKSVAEVDEILREFYTENKQEYGESFGRAIIHDIIRVVSKSQKMIQESALKTLLLDVYHDYQWGKIVDEMPGATVTEQKMELRSRIDAFEKENNL